MKIILLVSIIIYGIITTGCAEKSFYTHNSDGTAKPDSVCTDISNMLTEYENESVEVISKYTDEEIEIALHHMEDCEIRNQYAFKEFEELYRMRKELQKLHNMVDKIKQDSIDIHMNNKY